MKNIIVHLRPTFSFLIFASLIFGIIYPGIVTLILHTTFSKKANGDLIYQKGILRGSTSIGQSFTQPQYFWSRPSATTIPYDSSASTGSNISPTSKEYLTTIKNRAQSLMTANSMQKDFIPIDLVTASASGLDPHITVAAAKYQITRVAQTRHIDESALQLLISSMSEPRQFWILGEPRINVIKLNMKLDELSPYPHGK